jgi:hypothetical protein
MSLLGIVDSAGPDMLVLCIPEVGFHVVVQQLLGCT